MSQPPYGNPPEGPHPGPEEPGGAPTPHDPTWAHPPYPPPAASGPQPSYSYPAPYPHPQYGGGPGMPPPPGPYGSPYAAEPPPKRRGPLIALLAGGGAVVVIAVAALGLVLLNNGSGLHEVTPQCADIEPASMNDYVPDSELFRDDFVENNFWDDLSCEWESSATTSSPPASAYVFLMRNDGDDPVGITEADLEFEISDRTTSPVDGIGDEAHSWYDAANEEACVVAITSNIYVKTCYHAAADFMDLESVDEQTATDRAIQLSRDIVNEIESLG